MGTGLSRRIGSEVGAALRRREIGASREGMYMDLGLGSVAGLPAFDGRFARLKLRCAGPGVVAN